MQLLIPNRTSVRRGNSFVDLTKQAWKRTRRPPVFSDRNLLSRWQERSLSYDVIAQEHRPGVLSLPQEGSFPLIRLA